MSDNTIHIQEYLRRKRQAEGNGKKLYINHQTGKITGNETLHYVPPIDESKLDRIRQSITKINNLMASLKELSDERKS